jgi:hypothetical protein
MTYPGIRRETRKTEIDRVTWAEVTEKSYLTRVIETGEYQTNAVYFDRGFETVPEITWTVSLIEEWASAPSVDVSALSWILDDMDVYIGVVLQIRVCT